MSRNHHQHTTFVRGAGLHAGSRVRRVVLCVDLCGVERDSPFRTLCSCFVCLRPSCVRVPSACVRVKKSNRSTKPLRLAHTLPPQRGQESHARTPERVRSW